MAKLALPIALILTGVAALIVVGIVQGGVPELKVGGVVTAPPAPDKTVKVHGLLASVESDVRPLRFTLKDEKDAARRIAVLADVPRPDTFQLEYDVAVEGRWDAAGALFHATRIYTKCPSKYEAQEKLGIGSRKAYEEKLAQDATKAAGTGDTPAPKR